MIQLLHGDCLEVMRGMADNSVDVVVTDPPYGINENDRKIAGRGRWGLTKGKNVVGNYGVVAWDKGRVPDYAVNEIRRVSSQQVIFGGNYYADLLPASSSWIVWDKLNGENDFADCELAWTSHKKAVRRFRYMWHGMLKQLPEKRYHPTQKPLALMKWVIENYTKPNDLVLDPYAGSFTTGVACVLLGRRFIGIERELSYYEIGQRRIAEAQMQPALFTEAS